MVAHKIKKESALGKTEPLGVGFVAFGEPVFDEGDLTSVRGRPASSGHPGQRALPGYLKSSSKPGKNVSIPAWGGDWAGIRPGV